MPPDRLAEMQASCDRIMSASVTSYPQPIIPSPSVYPHHTHLGLPAASSFPYKSHEPSNTDSIDMQASRTPHSASAHLINFDYRGRRTHYPSSSQIQATPGMYDQAGCDAIGEQLSSESLWDTRQNSSGHNLLPRESPFYPPAGYHRESQITTPHGDARDVHIAPEDSHITTHAHLRGDYRQRVSFQHDNSSKSPSIMQPASRQRYFAYITDNTASGAPHTWTTIVHTELPRSSTQTRKSHDAQPFTGYSSGRSTPGGHGSICSQEFQVKVPSNPTHQGKQPERPIPDLARMQDLDPSSNNLMRSRTTSNPPLLELKARRVEAGHQHIRSSVIPDRPQPKHTASRISLSLKNSPINVEGVPSSVNMFRQKEAKGCLEQFLEVVGPEISSKSLTASPNMPVASSASTPTKHEKPIKMEQPTSIEQEFKNPLTLNQVNDLSTPMVPVASTKLDSKTISNGTFGNDASFDDTDVSGKQWQSICEELDRSADRSYLRPIGSPDPLEIRQEEHTDTAAVPESAHSLAAHKLRLSERRSPVQTRIMEIPHPVMDGGDGLPPPMAPTKTQPGKAKSLVKPTKRAKSNRSRLYGLANPLNHPQGKSSPDATTHTTQLSEYELTKSMDQDMRTIKESKRKISDLDPITSTARFKKFKPEQKITANQTSKAQKVPQQSNNPVRVKAPRWAVAPTEETPTVSDKPLPVLGIAVSSTSDAGKAAQSGGLLPDVPAAKTKGEKEAEDLVALAYRAISDVDAESDHTTHSDSPSHSAEHVAPPTASDLFGNAFSTTCSRLIVRDHHHLRAVFASLVVPQDGPLELDKTVVPALQEVKSIFLDMIPDLEEAGTLLCLAGQVDPDRPRPCLFPNLTHLYIKPAAQVSLIALLYEHYETGVSSQYISAFASIGSVHTLCTDHNVRALQSPFLRQSMESLRVAWPDMRVHHIHNVLDDLPWTMPAIEHHATWLPSAVPFKRRRWIDDDPPSPSVKKQKMKARVEDDELMLTLSKEEKAGPTANRFVTWAEGIARVVALDAVATRQFLPRLGYDVPNAKEVFALSQQQKEPKDEEINVPILGIPETKWITSIPSFTNAQGDADASAAALRGGAQRLMAIWGERRNKGSMFGLDTLVEEEALAFMGEAIKGQRYQRIAEVDCDSCGWSASVSMYHATPPDHISHA